MGLDMYAYTTSEKIEALVDFKVPEDATRISYWRKHYALDGWMGKLYRAKGGKDDFNVNPVRLTAEDLDRLEADIESGELYRGEHSLDSAKDNDRQFLDDARAALEQGLTVIYYNWW
jgi:hypothetical protein